MRTARRLFALLSCLLLPSGAFAADPAGLQHFEQKIRPVLVQHCYKCHSAEAKKLKGGLLLDTRAGLLKGGDAGPALVPNKPTESLLLKAIRHDGLEMPPEEKLPDAVIADFERWIQLGAPDPREGKSGAVTAGIDLEKGRKFWAFQPPRRQLAPSVKDAAWPSSDLDRFILARLEGKRLRPNPNADKATLLRRLSIDLIGLPPTPKELDDFVQDSTPDALERAVDRLLASPGFGERWGRHWLDLARYADSNGKDENLTFHEAFRYRDYVVHSVNQDKPFDRFLTEQLAGDLMPSQSAAERDESLMGTGFLVVGPKVLADRDFLKRKMDVVDEQIDTFGRTFMGMTLGCARCHDHKFDPIPTTDYYALAGIFASTRTLDGIKLGNAVVAGWSLRPLGGTDGEARLAAQKEHQKKLTALADQIKKVQAELKTQEEKSTMRVPGKLIGITVDDPDAKLVGNWKASVYTKPYVGAGYIHDDKASKGEKSATFTPYLPKAGEYEVYVSYTSSKGRATNVPVTIHHAGGDKTVKVNQEEAPKLDGLFRSIGKYRFEAGKAGTVTISNQDTEGFVIVDAVRFIPSGALAEDKEMAMGVPDDVRQKLVDSQSKLKQLQADEQKLKAAAPPAPKLIMAVRDEAKIENLKVNVRGNPHQLGAETPRGFLQVTLRGADEKTRGAEGESRGADAAPLAADRSGRLEMAKWLTDPAHPLTARVFVNRVWSHLLGEGLVRTVDNFGTQGETASHPELLDELACRFVAEGWSLKRLVREIVLSRTYRLSSAANAELVKADPENRLLGRAFRRRVDAEVIRDAILMTSGQLDRSMGGPVVSHLGERAIDNDSKGGVPTDANFRRSVYLPIIRNDLPQIFEVFDFADAEVATGKRDSTTVATQALFLMNNPFVLDQSQRTARRLLALQGDEARLQDLYRRALGRAPTGEEMQKAGRFIARFREKLAGDSKIKEPEVEAWSAVCLAVFGCTEFRFVE